MENEPKGAIRTRVEALQKLQSESTDPARRAELQDEINAILIDHPPFLDGLPEGATAEEIERFFLGKAPPASTGR